MLGAGEEGHLRGLNCYILDNFFGSLNSTQWA